MPRTMTSLRGWTIKSVTLSAGYYTITLVKGARMTSITIDAYRIFDKDGNHFDLGAL